jgi:ABC-type polysaccharide/polyol phosphate transport system, ATPase component
MSQTLVSVKGVGKRYCRDLRRSLLYGVEDIGRECLGVRSRGTLRKGEFWANKDISFELKRGDCLGLIGGNGAGKSTLLKMIAGLTKPDEGEIVIDGRVGALIELGAGFNPLLTGLENVYVNGAVLGMGKREVDRKLDSILGFADLGEFIDAPVQSYSSGMKVRLGFAVAVHLEPDILLIDEVLAVGDAGFRAKCYRMISDMLNRVSVIFVSHNHAHIARICNKGLHLSKGCVRNLGAIHSCVGEYLNETSSVPNQNRYGTQRARVESFNLRQGNGVFLIDMAISSVVPEVYLTVVIQNASGESVVEASPTGRKPLMVCGQSEFNLSMPDRLNAGVYSINLFLTDEKFGEHYDWWENAFRLNLTSRPVSGTLSVQETLTVEDNAPKD